MKNQTKISEKTSIFVIDCFGNDYVYSRSIKSPFLVMQNNKTFAEINFHDCKVLIKEVVKLLKKNIFVFLD